MPVTISGTSGVQLPLGSASAPSATNTTAQTTGVYYPTSTTLGLSTNGTNAVYVDASQNVGIGTTSPASRLEVKSTDGTIARFRTTSGSNQPVITIDASDSAGTVGFSTGASSSFPALTFSNGGSERMRITSDGQLWLNQTSSVLNARIQLTFNGSSEQGITIKNSVNSSSGGAIRFVDYTGFAGGGIFYSSANSITYGTSSDYRLKENIQPLIKGLETISALKPISYNWKNDWLKGEGFLAHELQAVVPAAVVGEKDAVDADGNIIPQNVDYSKIVVHLVAAIQELSAKVDAQAAEIAALKVKVLA